MPVLKYEDISGIKKCYAMTSKRVVFSSANEENTLWKYLDHDNDPSE